MLYSKKNYLLMALSALFILVGFILMSGGQSEDPTAFSPEIFSSRIVVAPIVCLIGFCLMVYAILVKPATRPIEKKEEEEA